MASGYGLKPGCHGHPCAFFLTPYLLVIFAPQMRICADESERTKAKVQQVAYYTLY